MHGLAEVHAHFPVPGRWPRRVLPDVETIRTWTQVGRDTCDVAPGHENRVIACARVELRQRHHLDPVASWPEAHADAVAVDVGDLVIARASTESILRVESGDRVITTQRQDHVSSGPPPELVVGGGADCRGLPTEASSR